MNNSDVNFTTKFFLNNQPKNIVITDTIDYAGLGETIANYKGVLLVAGPRGTIYENTDFNSPDIDPSISRASTTQINLPVDGYDGFVLHGEYIIKYTVKNMVTSDEYYKTIVYNFDFNEPTVVVRVESGPFTAKLRSYDDTNYGSDITLLTREHRVVYPDEILPSPPSDIVSTAASIETPDLYTNEWTCSVKTTVQYTQSLDGLNYEWYGESETVHCANGACINSMYDALDIMFQEYLDFLNTNPKQANLYRERLIRINTAWQLCDIAWQDNDEEEADRQAAIMQDILQTTGINTCVDGGDSNLVSVCPAWGGGGSPASYTFSNGINEVAGAVKLGGALTEVTNINIGAYSLTMGGVVSSDSASVFIDPANTLAQLKASDGATEGRVYAQDNIVILARVDLGTPANTRQYEITADGMVEADDYSGGYGLRSLVSKDYVDSNNDWGSQVVQSDATLTGDGTSGNPLEVTIPFPGFTDLNTDYGYTEPTHTFSEITSKPTTISGYGITDAVVDFTDLGDAPSSYAGHGGKFVTVKSSVDGLEFTTASGWVPSTGGIFTGVVIISQSIDDGFIIRSTDVGGTPATAEGGNNYMVFQDSDGDVQIRLGSNSSGDLFLKTYIPGRHIEADSDLNVNGNISLTGTVDAVDIAAFKTSYDSHTHPWSDITGEPTTLAGYGITDGMLNTANSWTSEFSVKGSAVAGDYLVIEDSADSYTKKYVQIGNLPTSISTYIGLSDTSGSYSGSANYVLRVNSTPDGVEFYDISGDFISTSDGTINALSQKATPVNADVLIIEDSASSYAQKKILWSSLPGGSGSFISHSDTPANYTGAGGFLVMVNSTPDAIEFIDPAGYNLSNFNNDLSSGDVTAGSQAQTQVAYWNAVSKQIEGNNNFVWTGSTLDIIGDINVNTIDEHTTDSGVTIETVLLKDGLVDGVNITDHSARHENGGADEISVNGLSGLLADKQTPLVHTMDSETYHSASGLTEGWVIAADTAVTFSWRQLLGSEINNDLGWVVLSMGTNTQIPFMNGTTDFSYSASFTWNGTTLFTGAISATGTIAVANAAGPSILNEPTSATNPVFCPDRGSPTTGLGGSVSDTLDLIIIGTSIINIAAGEIGIVRNVRIGNSYVITSPLTGSFSLAARDIDGASETNFITFTAGTTPTMTFPQSGGGTTNFLRADGSWSDPLSKTTLAGYGITDAYTKTNLQTSGQASVHWGNLTNTPTILSGYGISDTMSNFNTACSNGNFVYVSSTPSDDQVAVWTGSSLIEGSTAFTFDTTGLHIALASGNAHLYLKRTNTVTGSRLSSIYFANYLDNICAEVWGGVDAAVDAGNLIFRTRPTGGALADRLKIDSVGNVSIEYDKSITNTGGLQINSDQSTIGVAGDIRLINAGDIAVGIYMETSIGSAQINSSGTSVDLAAEGDNGLSVCDGYSYMWNSYLRVECNEESGYAGTFWNDGNNSNRWGIKISCGSDSQSSGTHYFLRGWTGNSLSEEGGLSNVSGTFGVYQGSDRRLKTDIVQSKLDAVDILTRLRVCDYKRIFNDGSLSKAQTGWIAQDAEKIYPAMHMYIKDTDFHTIRPTELLPVLHLGWQNHESRIDYLERKVKELEGEVRILKSSA